MNHHFAVYDIMTKQILMIVTDAANPGEPTFNAPGSAQVPISITTYNLLYPNLDAIIKYVSGLVP